jgi:protein-disulfide isomerase
VISKGAGVFLRPFVHNSATLALTPPTYLLIRFEKKSNPIWRTCPTIYALQDMNSSNKAVSLLAAVVLLSSPVAAQQLAPSISHEQADNILTELRQIRILLEKRETPAGAPAQQPQAAKSAKVKVDPSMVLGKKDAPITVVEFTDAQCGYCRNFHATTFAEMRTKLIASGKVRFVSRDLPLDVDSVSMVAAEAMRCAADQGLYWNLREAIMTTPERLSQDSIVEHARAVGANVDKLKACLALHTYRAAIQRDIDEATSLNIGGTPAFIIGKTTADGVDGLAVMGALSYAAFEARIHDAESK